MGEPTNTDRAAWADHALQMFQMTTGTDREDAVCDLLANLMHLADDEGTDFAADLARAQMHYAAEIEEETTQGSLFDVSTMGESLTAKAGNSERGAS